LKKLSMLCTIFILLICLIIPVHANASDYHFDAPDAGLFGRPTSDDTIYVDTGEALNTDQSKNAALIPPAFGSPTSNLPNSGEWCKADKPLSLRSLPAR